MHCDLTCLGNAFLTVSREVSRNSVQPCEVGLSATLNVALTTYDLPCVIEADFWLALWRSFRTSANNPICFEGARKSAIWLVSVEAGAISCVMQKNWSETDVTGYMTEPSDDMQAMPRKTTNCYPVCC